MNTVLFETEKKDGTFRTWLNVAMPVKYGQMLDEQLDYAVVTLVRVRKKIFKPLTRAKLTVFSNTKYGGVQSKKIDYFIANDEYRENPVGSGIYDHEISLIELTKFLECFPVESLCFTHPKRNFNTIQLDAPTSYEGYFLDDGSNGKPDFISFPQGWYTSPAYAKTKFKLKPFVLQGAGISSEFDTVKATIKTKENIYEQQGSLEVVVVSNSNGIVQRRDLKVTFPDEEYSYDVGENIIQIYLEGDGVSFMPKTLTITVKVNVVENTLPFSPWTEELVTKRLFDLVEPLRKNDKPRFMLNTENKAVFKNIAPEYTFTRMNLRECLQMQGGMIHGEPRLRINEDNQNEVYFDWYAGREYAKITNYKKGRRKLLNTYKYATSTGSWEIEQACNRMESYMDNLVSRTDWEKATVGQPVEAIETATVGGQTLRSELYSRIEENDNVMFITQYPIDKIVKFEVFVDNTNDSTKTKFYDITKYVYEQSVYNNLSGYDSKYPSKSHALYYKQGEKNIKGFFYKREAVLQPYENYSIKNIVIAASGIFPYPDYTTLKMRLTYVPIYSTRVGHGKQYLSDYLPLPRTQNYTQGDNSVESRYFGQNLKATVQRLGNIEQYYTFVLENVNNIPKAGRLWDDEHYISVVNVSVGKHLLHVTVGLSKHFNRKSKYIGASSIKRIYEVSEQQARQRHSLYQDYIVISDNQYDHVGKGTYLSSDGFDMAVNGIFDKNFSTDFKKSVAEISNVLLVTTSKKGTLNQNIYLPVISAAFGNCMEFSWEMEDNFSAGKTNEVSDYGVFTVGTEYSDYYGRAYYLYFSLQGREYNLASGAYEPATFPKAAEGALPKQGFLGVDWKEDATLRNPIILRKDSREALKMSASIEYVAANKDYIIGAALPLSCPLVHYTAKVPHLYVLKRELGVFEDKLSEEDMLYDLGEISVTSVNFQNKRLEGILSTEEGLSWCYAYPIEHGEGIEVEDDDGNISTIYTNEGGEILLGKNTPIKEGDLVGSCYFTKINDVYEYKKLMNI